MSYLFLPFFSGASRLSFLFFALFFADTYVQSHPTQRNSSMRVRFQLTLAWFDESWGLRLDRPPPPPDPAALDPVLA